MKCAVCGKEFGNGANCKNCGTDRVTGLGNYSGYDAPSNSSRNVESSSSIKENPHQIVDSEPKIVKVNSMICYACGEIIPADSKFCPHCSTSLYVTCPKCGHEYSSQYPACSKCGTNRQKYRDEQLERIHKENEERWKREQKRKEELKRHEEWLKTPEGQAAQKKKEEERIQRERTRKGQEKATKIRSEIEARNSLMNFEMLFGLFCGGFFVVILLAALPIAGVGALALFVVIIIWLGNGTERDIKKWKEDNPNDIATPYL